MFKSEIGRSIGIDIKSGAECDIGGIMEGPKEVGYLHKIKIYVDPSWQIHVRAVFIEGLSANGILGRNGFFDNFHVCFDHSVVLPVVEIQKIQRPN